MDILTVNQTEPYAIWTYDFPPDSLDDVVGNDHIIQTIKRYTANRNIPNIILTGNNGTGKNTIARLVAKSHLGDKYQRACLRIDGSIHRGKDTVTLNPEKKAGTDNHYYGMDITSFAKTRVTMESYKKKIIIIYNFEHMTTEAQNALRAIIETYSKKNRFILICNDLTDVIEAIQSRCVCLKTKELDDEEQLLLMKKLLEKKSSVTGQKISVSQEILDTICLLSNGDMKKAINYLQIISNTENPTVDQFYHIFNIPPIHVMKNILKCCQDPSKHLEAYKEMTLLLDNGYNYCDILEIMMNTLVRFATLDKKLQIEYLKILVKCYHTAERTSSTIYIYNLLAEFCTVSMPEE